LAVVEQAWAQAEAVPGSLRRPLVPSALGRQAASPDLRRGLVVAVLQAWHPLPEVATARPRRACSAPVTMMVLRVFRRALAVTTLRACLQAFACQV